MVTQYCKAENVVIIAFILMCTCHVTLGQKHAEGYEDPSDMRLNIKERDDILRILTNNLRTGRELYDKDIRDYLLSLVNEIRDYLLKSTDFNEVDLSKYIQKPPKRGSDKRQQISVSHLAQLLNSMKTRDAQTEEGVKLQSLRFGRK